MEQIKTVREVSALWKADKQQYVKQSTIAAYALILENHILPCTYRSYYKQLLKELDIPSLKFHGLRHSFATRCIESRCDYKTVSVILGHANISTTLNLYVHPNMEQKKKCISRMFKGLGH